MSIFLDYIYKLPFAIYLPAVIHL